MQNQRLRTVQSQYTGNNEVHSVDDLSASLLQLHHLEEQIQQDKQIIKKSKNVFVGTGFTFDLTQFFKFKKREQLQSGQAIGSIFYQLSGSGISWIILAYSVINASFIPVWILSSKINKFMALTWRYIFQSILMIPFVLYEKRTIKFQNSHKYQLTHIFNTKHLKKLYLCSLAACLWYVMILTAGQWTYLSHAFYLGSLTNFFLSLARHRHGYVHEYQIGGQVAVLVGIFFTTLDTYYFRTQKITPEQQLKHNNFYLTHTTSQRLCADLICLLASIISSKFSTITTGAYNIFPSYLCMMIIDIMNVINLAFAAYFLNGVSFDLTEKWGFFSMFLDYQFALFFYSGIVLSVGLVVSYMLVARMFPNFVVPSIAYFFEPGIATLLFNLTNIQALPRSFSLIGYTIMTPGMFLISIGQWLFLRNKKREQMLQSIRYYELKQITHELSVRSNKSDNEQKEDKKLEIIQD